MTTMARRRTTVRANYGSHRQVKRVFVYDVVALTASVQYADGSTDTTSVSELEAIEPDGNTYGNLDEALRRMANEVIE